MNFFKDERIALFIDGSRLYSTAKALDIEVDYSRLLTEFKQHGHLLRAYYYTALLETEDYSPIRPLVDWLQYNGFHVITKPAREFTDATGHRRVKGNMDVEMVIDMLKMADHVDHIVLFSGDGDFAALVPELQFRGVRVSVVSTCRTSPPMISDELRRRVDHFIDLVDLENKVRRDRDDHTSCMPTERYRD